MNTLNFAIWASKNNKILFPKKYNQNKLHIKELHVNLWKLKNVDFAIDIGLMLKKTPFLDTINFFIDTTDTIEFMDINGSLSDSCNMLYTIFNDFLDDCSCDIHFGSAKKIKTRGGLERDTFCLFPISNEQYKIRKFSSGKIIEIKNLPITQACRNCGASNIYLRFRLKGNFIRKAFYDDESASSRLQNFASKLTIIETKFNVLRSLPVDIRKEIQRNEAIIEKVNFFFMCPSNESIDLSSMQYKGVRCLEGDIWNKYFEAIKDYEEKNTKIFAYQWKTTSSSNDYSLLIRIKSDEFKLKKFLYVSYIAVFLNLLAAFIFLIPFREILFFVLLLLFFIVSYFLFKHK